MTSSRKIFQAILIMGAVLIAIFLAFYVGTKVNRGAISARSGVHEKSIYSCPMHPSIVSHEPGECPICHMKLQKVENHSGPRTGKGKIVFYRHPMRPDITSTTRKKDEMGMDFIPVYENDSEQDGASDVGGDVEGRAGFSLSSERQQMIGITTAKAELKPLQLEIRASGKVAFDPELFTVIDEYRQALFSREEMKESPYPSLRKQADDLAQSARTKLKLMGLVDAQINKLAARESSAMDLLLPKGKVWIYAEVYEFEMAGVKVKQQIEVSTPSLPGKTFSGEITSISPILNDKSRTLRVLAQVPDPDGDLKPDGFVNVKIINDLGKRLVVPTDSVLHSGNEDFLFLVKSEDQFEPRSVTVGFKTAREIEILSGVQEGDIVVTAANFLLDSEARLRSVVEGMKRGRSPGNEKK